MIKFLARRVQHGLADVYIFLDEKNQRIERPVSEFWTKPEPTEKLIRVDQLCVGDVFQRKVYPSVKARNVNSMGECTVTHPLEHVVVGNAQNHKVRVRYLSRVMYRGKFPRVKDGASNFFPSEKVILLKKANPKKEA